MNRELNAAFAAINAFVLRTYHEELIPAAFRDLSCIGIAETDDIRVAVDLEQLRIIRLVEDEPVELKSFDTVELLVEEIEHASLFSLIR